MATVKTEKIVDNAPGRLANKQKADKYFAQAWRESIAEARRDRERRRARSLKKHVRKAAARA